MKYESSITYHSKVITNIKDLFLQTSPQTGKQADRAKELYTPDLSMFGHTKGVQYLDNALYQAIHCILWTYFCQNIPTVT